MTTQPATPTVDGRPVEFHGANVTSDAGLLAYRELDKALQLTESAADVFHDRGPAATRSTAWPRCCDSRYTVGSPGTKTSTTLNGAVDPAMRHVVGGHTRTSGSLDQ